MVEVTMPRDIREYKPKIIGPFTLRQIICVSIGAAYAAPIAIIIPVPPMMKLLIGILLMLPMFVSGWVEIFGMTFEQYIIYYVKNRVLKPKTRVYSTESEGKDLFHYGE